MTDISVITSTLNSSEWVQRCIVSVLAQEDVRVQHVLIDGGSTDGTVDILKAQTDPRLTIVLGRDSGVYEAWNKALKHVTGQWILFLGSDDFLLNPQVFKRAMERLRDVKERRVFAYANLLKGKVEGRGVGDRYLYCELPPRQWGGPTPPFPPHPSTFHSRELFTGPSSFDEAYRYCSDAKFFHQNSGSSRIIELKFDAVWFSRGGLTNRGGNQIERWLESNALRKELNIKTPKWVMFRSFLSAVKTDVKFWFQKLQNERT